MPGIRYQCALNRRHPLKPTWPRPIQQLLPQGRRHLFLLVAERSQETFNATVSVTVYKNYINGFRDRNKSRTQCLDAHNARITGTRFIETEHHFTLWSSEWPCCLSQFSWLLALHTNRGFTFIAVVNAWYIEPWQIVPLCLTTACDLFIAIAQHWLWTTGGTGPMNCT